MNTSSAIDSRNGSEIAVIGMSGRFPGARNVDEFWRNLRDGVESISFFADQELASSGIDPVLLKNPDYVKAKGVVADAELFDASFFGLTPREAETMDPQHRLLLECAWEALENAGHDPERCDKLIGVYAGVGQNTYLLNNLYPHRALRESVGEFQLMIGNDKDYATTRTSYKMNLRGPSVVVQTACSTALVAVAQACQGLLSGDCDMALAGASTINVPQKGGYLYHKGGIQSPDGHCRAFDAQAQGTVFSSAVGIVVLKRLEDALVDGDAVHAVIKGAAINNDGSFKAGYTAPSVEGQAKVIRTAQLLAEVHPETITYVETHGTATALGDPIEIAALTQAFRAGTQKTGFCAIGSVKTNIGHTDASAGIAGLIKTILMLKNKMIPPSLHFNRPNPEIDFAKSPFYVNTRLAAWNTDAVPRRAGVSSFGIGGTNAHVIVEEAPAREASGNSRPCSLLLLSAKTRSALDDSTKNLVEHMKQHPLLDLADIAFTLQVGRQAFDHQRMAVCRDVPEAIEVLESLHADRVLTSYQEPGHREIVFLFSGQGSQYVNMGLELYNNEPLFRAEVDNASKLLLPHLSLDLRDILYPDEQTKEDAAHLLTQTYITQPALFTIEYALAKLWMSWGVAPTALVGHSIGEYVAACLAGVFSLQDALTLVATRGRLMQGLPGGSMLAVPLPEQELRPFLREDLSLAVINGPSLCVVSGEKQHIEEFKEQLSKRNIEGKYLQTSHAFHSKMMEPILEVFVEKLKSIDLKPPQIPIVSNVTGTWITTDEATDPRYWARHLRQTVRFSDCLAVLLEKPGRIFLEVGPGQTFKVLLNQQPHKSQAHAVLSSIRHPKERKSDVAFILHTLGQICLAGTRIDWAGFYQEVRRLRLPLPTYPFDRKRYWISAAKEQTGEPSLAEALPEQDVRLEGLPSEKKSDPAADWTSQDDIRSRIIAIWKETLGIDQVNDNDDFQELGGNSLIALRMLSQIEKVFGKQLPLSIFKSPTVGQLVSFIQSEEAVRL